MQQTIDETNRRRAKQMTYNEEHGITPETIFRSKEEILAKKSILDIRKGSSSRAYIEPEEKSLAADPIVQYMTRDHLESSIKKTESQMRKAAKDLDFISAAQYRDELFALKKQLKTK